MAMLNFQQPLLQSKEQHLFEIEFLHSVKVFTVMLIKICHCQIKVLIKIT